MKAMGWAEAEGMMGGATFSWYGGRCRQDDSTEGWHTAGNREPAAVRLPP